jgi:hypothetical protein
MLTLSSKVYVCRAQTLVSCGELNNTLTPRAKTPTTMTTFTLIWLLFVGLCVQISNGFVGYVARVMWYALFCSSDSMADQLILILVH